jgi:glycosyltransferase involved in cell wall biosynthesis
MLQSNLKHIAIVLTADPSGGGKFQYSLSILKAICLFDKQKYKISVLYENHHWIEFIDKNRCSNYNFRQKFIERIVRKSFLLIPYIGLSLWRSISDFAFELFRILKRINPDLVLYPNNDSFVYETRQAGIIPIFDLMHIYHPEFPELSIKGTARKRDLHYSRVCKYARAILVDSEIGKHHVCENYKVDEKKIYVLPYIAPPYVYEQNIDNIETNILMKFRLPNKFIFYPAKFWQHKNHAGLLRALAILKHKRIEIPVVFVGSPSNASEVISKLINDLDLKNQVIVLNYVNNQELVALYKKALALVMPTFLGPTNIPQLEAFAIGCPVITSNIYGIPKQVNDAAILVDPYDPQDIAEKILIVWENERLRMELVNNGYIKHKQWNLNHFSKNLKDIIDSI